MDRLVKRTAVVSVWRDSIPSDPTNYKSQRHTPGQQLDISRKHRERGAVGSEYRRA